MLRAPPPRKRGRGSNFFCTWSVVARKLVGPTRNRAGRTARSRQSCGSRQIVSPKSGRFLPGERGFPFRNVTCWDSRRDAILFHHRRECARVRPAPCGELERSTGHPQGRRPTTRPGHRCLRPGRGRRGRPGPELSPGRARRCQERGRRAGANRRRQPREIHSGAGVDPLRSRTRRAASPCFRNHP